MCHTGQKRINKIATGIREGDKRANDGFYTHSIKYFREFVKEEKLHYTKKMVQKAKYKGKW